MMGRQKFLRPISELLDGVERLSLGVYDGQIKLEACRDLENIANYVNSLGADNTQMLEHLESVVKAKTQQAESSKEKLNAIFSSVLDAIISIDQKGIILSLNKAALEMFAYEKPSDLIGKNISLLMSREDSERHDEYLRARDTKIVTRIIGKERIIQGKRRDSVLFPLSLTVTEGSVGGTSFYTGVVRDLSEKLAVEQKLAEKETLFNIAVHASLTGLVIVDNNLRIVETNAALLNWLGHKRDQIVGMRFYELLVAEEREKFSVLLNSMLEGDVEDNQQDVLCIKNDGSEVWGMVSSAVAKVPRSEQSYLVIQIADIQKEKQLSLELEDRNLALEKSNSDLDQFAYIASHDLKSPLNAIQKLVSWIEEDCGDDLPETGMEYFGLLKSRASRMGKLLDDLLLYSRVGKYDYEYEPIQLSAFVVDIFELLDKPKGFECEVVATEVMLPRIPLEIIIRNLMSNSIKHAEKEAGLIRVTQEVENNFVSIKVSDDGPGIPPHLHGKAMEMFQTLKPRDQVEGSGMGLAMIKRIVKHYYGDVKIESDGVSGTSVFVKFPLERIKD